MSLIDYELSLLHTSSVSKFYKSWLIFYRFGLVDAEFNAKGICPGAMKTLETGIVCRGY